MTSQLLDLTLHIFDAALIVSLDAGFQLIVLVLHCIEDSLELACQMRFQLIVVVLDGCLVLMQVVG